jgi:hypothetical protein
MFVFVSHMPLLLLQWQALVGEITVEGASESEIKFFRVLTRKAHIYIARLHTKVTNFVSTNPV